jgi:hypothetical protein
LEVVEVERPPHPNGEGYPEAEFIATGMGGDEFPFAAFAPHLHGTILLTGLGGERMWGCSGPVSRTAFQDDEPAGASLAEFRLRCGFVHVPVGWIGFEGQPELRVLCRSEAMRPWHTGTDYERPIARRIIEERGVPRGRFATTKRAASATFHYASYWWSRAALEDLARFERQHLAGTWPWLTYRAQGLLRTWWLSAFFAAKNAAKRVGAGSSVDTLREWLLPELYDIAYTHPRYVSMAFLWGQSKIRERYPRAPDLGVDATSIDRAQVSAASP